MDKNNSITREQFKQIVDIMEDKLFFPPPESPEPVPVTDCDALLAFIQAAQAIYTRDCPIA